MNPRGLYVFVLAAGMGTRMQSAEPKVLHELAGEPMLARVLRATRGLGPQGTIVVVGHHAEAVSAAVAYATGGDSRVRCVLQDPPQGTGDAARRAITMVPAGYSGDILIVYGDMPCVSTATLQRFIDFHRASDAALSIVSARVDHPASYGRVLRGPDGMVEAIVEARDASPDQLSIDEINAGVYLADAATLTEALAALTNDNAQREYYLTDIVAIARRRGRKVTAWLAESIREFAGVNSREELAAMETDLRAATNRRLMASGVTLIDPATAYISEQAEFGPDCIIGPNVQILGECRFGAGVRIEGTAWLRNVTVGNDCHLKLGVRAEQCRIGDRCEIGPFANLRPGTELAGHNRVGNFVETKNAQLGEGSKASHLSYLGDVTVGRDTNIGCGVITVNYDGFDKHPTHIGDRCMVGCDSQLIAPVTVGDDAYVASGTTVVRDVSAGALAFSAHPQGERPGWTAKFRAQHDSTSGRRNRP
jgi:bifunctional UDP-N-acetylglucosamine pyrophosphorylase/glucosamine-1-phosphate N-acetyltransferase